MSGVNKAILIGRLGKDPEVRTFETGAKKVTFTLATSETYRDKENRKIEQTEWHNIVCWRNLADIAEMYLRKGKMIYVEGKIKTRSWDDDQGNKKYITEIEASTFTMLGNKGEEGEKSTETKLEVSPPIPSPEPFKASDIDNIGEVDDLPF